VSVKVFLNLNGFWGKETKMERYKRGNGRSGKGEDKVVATDV